MAYATVGTEEEANMKDQWSGMLDRVLEWSFVGLVFLMPLFFLPLTTEALELNKQMLLFVGALWLGLIFTTRIVVTGHIEIKRSPLYWGFLGMLVAWILATIFSSYQYNSIIGLERQEFVSLASIIALLVVTFIVGNIGTPRIANKAMCALLCSTALVTIVGAFHMFGVSLFPWDFTKASAFNPVGLYVLWGSLATITLVMAVTEIIRVSLVELKNKLPTTILLALYSILHLILLVIFDNTVLWLALAVGLVISLVVLYLKLPQNQKVSWLILPCFLVVFAVTMTIVNPPRFVNLPIVAMPSLSASADITLGALKESPALGIGPGNFLNAFTKYRPSELNRVSLLDLWTTRFDQSSSYFLTKVAETGTVGLIAMLALILLLIWQILAYLKREDLNETSLSFVGVISALGAMGVTVVLLPSNMTVTFVWWLLIALALLFTAKPGKVMEGSQSNKFVILSSLVLYTLVALGFVGILFAGNRYRADMAFANAMIVDRKLSIDVSKRGKAAAPEEIDTLIQGIGGAIAIDQKNHLYPRALSQAINYKLARIIASAKSEDEARAALQTLPQQAIAAANRSVALNPKDVRNYDNVAQVYQSILPFANDAEKLALDSYKKAVELDPTNPVARFDLARLYLDSAVLHKRRANVKDMKEDVKKKEADAMNAALGEAEKYLNETLELKQDFAPAYFHKATIQSEKGNKEEALKLLDTALVTNARLAQLRSADEGLFYLTGLAYASLNEKDRAANAFRAAFTLRPNYQLALWNYAVLQLDKGNKDEAIAALERILQYDPENKTVKEQLEKIKSGKVESKEGPKGESKEPPKKDEPKK